MFNKNAEAPRQQIWIVEVTYGTKPHQIYASVPSKDSAETLKACAKKLGYRDARVVSARDFYEAQSRSREREAATAESGSQTPRMPDMRSRPRKSVA